MSSRYLAPLVFATAALASIATSQAANWVLTDDAPIEPVDVSSGETLTFGITGQASGPANGHQGGDISVTVTLTAASPDFDMTEVAIVFASEDGDPTRREQQNILVSQSGPVTVTLTAPAWVVCEAGPCFDDFLLTIAGVEAGASLTVRGSVNAVLLGLDPSPSPDHGVAVEVTRL